MKNRRFKIIALVLFILLLVSLTLYLGWGTYKISPIDTINTLLGQGTKLQNAAILNLRLPRMLVAISVKL